MLAREYAREALKQGLALEAKLGTNPYKFGMIGSTDTHTGLATMEEDNFFGKHTGYEPSPKRMGHPFWKNEKGVIMGWGQVASGLAAVWATENTRESIFDAMERKEVYATTGSRMMVRFFGGWDFTADDVASRTRRSSVTPRAYLWAAICRHKWETKRLHLWSMPSGTPSAATLTASRSLKGGWTVKARHMRRSMT